MTVYLDIVFIENTLMNYVILLATGIICKEKIRHFRIIISSLLGSLYAIAYYITRFSIYISILAKIILSIAMVYIAFKPSRIKAFFKYITLFYLTSFAFGGCAFAILYYLDTKKIMIFKGTLIGIYPIKATLIGGIVGFIIINLAFRIVKSRLEMRDMFCRIKLFINGQEKNISAMLDTGNFLKDPITGTPVIIVEKESLQDIIPEEILSNIKEIINGNYQIKDETYLSKIRILPFSSLGKNNGMLLGIKIDKAEAELNEEYITREDIIVGICEDRLSTNNKYNCLLGLNYIDG